MLRVASLPAFALVIGSLAGCADAGDGGPDEPETPGVPAACADVPVDRFRELMVVDEAIVTDPRSLNATAGAWSFRRVIEALTPAGDTPSSYVKFWFDSWVRTQLVNTFPVTPRPQIETVLLCPWLKRRPENGCDADCRNCEARELDLTVAPFRLLAIVNRIDLRVQDHERAPAGEGRMVFGLTNGSGDDPDAAPLRMTVIFEFAFPTDVDPDPRYWAERWHALGDPLLSEDDFKSGLQDITDAFIGPTTLNQIRTNERDLEWRWEFRQFEHDGRGLPMPAITSNTPDITLNSSSMLKEYLLANRDEVMSENGLLPVRLCGGAAPGGVVWRIDIDEPLRRAFARQTCNGCHMSEELPVDAAFHVSPQRRGRESLSPFLFDPVNPTADELANREQSLRLALCE